MSRFVDRYVEDVPMIHKIGCTPTGLRIEIHKDAMDCVEDITRKAAGPIFNYYEKTFELPQFRGIVDRKTAWGYGEILKSVDSEDQEVVSWECNYPLRARSTPEDYWQKLFATSATLDILYTTIGGFEGRTNSSEVQLFGMELLVKKGLHGSEMNVFLSRKFTDWLIKQEACDNRMDVVQKMKDAYVQMYGKEVGMFDVFKARIREPFFVDFIVPGDNSCGLSPRNYTNPGRVEGYNLYPHNIDNPRQQISLITGIASFCDLIRRDEKVNVK